MSKHFQVENKNLDLRDIPIKSMKLSSEDLTTELRGRLDFTSDESLFNDILEIANSGRACDITYRVKFDKNDESIEDVIANESFITSLTYDVIANERNVTLEFITANAGIRIYSIIRSKDKKEFILKPAVADLVKRNCNPSKLSHKELEKIVLACQI